MYNDRFSEVFLSISKHLKSADLPMVDGLIYICTVLRKTFDHYDWVGFYFADLDKKMLHLKAYSGNPVEHQQEYVVKLQFPIRILSFLMSMHMIIILHAVLMLNLKS